MNRNHNKRRPRKREYDPVTDYYMLTERELANLAIGRANNAAIGAVNSSRVHKLVARGRSASDVMLITGLSRATVYRALRRLYGEPQSAEPEAGKAQRAMNEQRAIDAIRTARAARRAAQSARVCELVAAGHSVADIMLITGLGQAAVYRMVLRVNGEQGNARIDPLLL
jgi:transposase